MKVRFAPSPTGSLHIGNAPGAVIGRSSGGTMRTILDLPSISLPAEREPLQRFRELRAPASNALDVGAAKSIVRELKAAGGHLRAVRQAPTGRVSRTEVWAVPAALGRGETLRRVDAAL